MTAAPGRDARLLELIRRARAAEDIAELRFILVNDTHLLRAYRQAALWCDGAGVQTLSGVMDLERNAPYAQWLDRCCRQLPAVAARVTAEDLDDAEARAWGEWLPQHALWLPFSGDVAKHGPSRGGLLLASDEPWSDDDVALLTDWVATWYSLQRAWGGGQRERNWRLRWRAWRRGLRRRWLIAAAIAAAVLSIPVPLTVLAPGELVPAAPIAVRAPQDGVVSQFHVRPNQRVRAGELLVSFDDVAVGSRHNVAQQALLTAEAELRQIEQQALNDARARAQLPGARGNVAERRAEVALLKTQKSRSQILASQDGYVLFDDPIEWIGRPVTTGERILRIASPEDKEIEAWVAVGDAIPLAEGARVQLHLSSSPLDPVVGRIRYVAYEAVKRPDGVYAYRARATPEGATTHRIGLKGTARLSGETVPLGFWLVRRPVATIREFLGL